MGKNPGKMGILFDGDYGGLRGRYCWISGNLWGVILVKPSQLLFSLAMSTFIATIPLKGEKVDIL